MPIQVRTSLSSAATVVSARNEATPPPTSKLPTPVQSPSKLGLNLQMVNRTAMPLASSGIGLHEGNDAFPVPEAQQPYRLASVMQSRANTRMVLQEIRDTDLAENAFELYNSDNPYNRALAYKSMIK